jgi:anti-sigma factor RsiW
MTRPPDELLPEDLLSAYLDGEVTPEERARVERELAVSPEWRAVLDELTETRALLRNLPVRDAPEGFWADLLTHDDAGEGGGAGTPPAPPASLTARRRRRTRIAGWVAGAAAAAAVVAVILVPRESTVEPPVASLVTSHAARSSVSDEPVSQLAPVATPVRVGRG